MLDGSIGQRVNFDGELLKRSDIFFTIPNYVTSALIQEYGASWVAWGFLPISSGSMNYSYYVNLVQQLHEAGVKFQARIEWDVVWEGMKQFSSNFQDVASIGFDGEPLTFPWTRGHLVFCSHNPLFQNYLKFQIDMALKGKPDSIMFDSQTSTPLTYTWGGCFCNYCMADFREYLKKHYTESELQDLGIDNIETFNYHDFLVEKGWDAAKYNNAVKKWPNDIPLAEQYRKFQIEYLNSLLKELINYTKAKAGYPIAISTSSPIIEKWSVMHGARSIYLPEINFYTLEVPHHANSREIPEDVILYYKFAEALNRPLVLTAIPNPDWLTIYRERRVNLVRAWIAQAYAYGANFMVPYHMWAYDENGNHYWYKCNPGDYDYIYRFIRNNAKLFDGYDSISHVGLLYSHTAYRSGSNTIWNVCVELTRENIPFRLVISGDDWWPKYFNKTELETLDAIILTSDKNYLDPAQKAILDEMSAKTVDWPNRTRLFQLLPKEITVEGASNIIVVPRVNRNNNSAPFILHLLNHNYDPSTDTIIEQRNFDLIIKNTLFDSNITKAVLYEPCHTPIELKIQKNADSVKIMVPHLGFWGIIKLEHG
ncbi:hypothetical protein J7L27_03695 [Candidatus Bathyarchaeota archaeon]|nr:hypothetical protein [Candidatus Bathyarchaeota archaeon]